MKLYHFWAVAEKSIQQKEKSLLLRKWAGSNVSVEEARRLASEMLDNLVVRLSEVRLRDLKSYSYVQKDIREEIIEELTSDRIVTRNRNGCLVLNTTEAMFVDVDRRFGSGWLARLFGKTEEQFLSHLETWMASHPTMGARVYRTAGGLRYLFTHEPIRPTELSISWLSELKSDKLYIRLCKAQECFRARLSPKPWRLQLAGPPGEFPREKGPLQNAFEVWLATYQNKSRSWAVCSYIKTIGNPRVHAALEELVRHHDDATRALTHLPLA